MAVAALAGRTVVGTLMAASAVGAGLADTEDILEGEGMADQALASVGLA